MNWLDIVIVAIIALTTLLGFRKGFIHKILGIVGLIVGVVVAVKFYKTTAPLFQSIFKASESVSYILGFLLIVLIVYFIALWLARFFSDMNSGMSLINRILGAALGFVQGLILASLLLVNLALIDIPSQEIRNGSIMNKMVSPIAPALFNRVIGYSPELMREYEEYKLSPSNQPKQNGKDSDNRGR